MERRSRRCCEADAVEAAKVIKIPACQLPMHAVKRLRLAARAALAKTQQIPGLNIASAPSMLDSDLFPITPTFSASRSPPMNTPQEIDHALEERLSRRLLDTLIRAGLVFALVWLCFHFFAPFLTMMLWALILAVTLYPLQQKLAKRVGGRQGRAAMLIVVLGLGLIVTPTVMLSSSFGDSVHELINGVNDNTLSLPAPPASIAALPIVGKKVHATWSQAHNDLPAFVRSMQPKVSELSSKALSIVASLGGGLLKFLFSFIIAGIMMAYAEAGAPAMQAIFERVAGIARGAEFTQLTTSTVRAVASGVIGIACIQALLIGISLIIANVPFAGALALVTLMLGVAQVPAAIVTLPVIGWMWTSGDYATTPAIAYSVLILIAGSVDNVLKPLMLGRGVDAPMPVILLGALGGMATDGILGMFVGAAILAVGYQIFMRWVDDNPERARQPTASHSVSMTL
jgi:predicted PurR-regulated permease PerM